MMEVFARADCKPAEHSSPSRKVRATASLTILLPARRPHRAPSARHDLVLASQIASDPLEAV
jgi:hypothetical protein